MDNLDVVLRSGKSCRHNQRPGSEKTLKTEIG